MNKGVMAALAAVVVVAGVAGWYLTSPKEEAAAEAVAPVEGITEMVIGAEDAPVEIIEYASYTCPHCATFHTDTFKKIKADYVDNGQVRFIYREVYFDRYGLWASMIARCGGETRFFGISDMIYSQQSVWARLNDPVAIAEALRKIGRTAGMNDEELNACLEDAEKAEKLVAWYEANGARDDITSTPSFLINGKKHSNMSYADFKTIIDKELGN